MNTLKLTTGLLMCLASIPIAAQEPAWNASSIKDCDRACLVGFMDGYMNAIIAHNPKAVPPLSVDVRMTENTGQMDVGEGVLWRSKVVLGARRAHPSRRGGALRDDSVRTRQWLDGGGGTVKKVLKFEVQSSK